MNNNQFRRLLFDNPNGQNGSVSTPSSGGAPSTLGAKKSGFMPMTPRTVKGGIDTDFARQVRERKAALQPAKKFRSAAPKGVKYGAGYQDRAKARLEGEQQDDSDDKASRVKALEEQMKLGQISLETFEALRDQITGGDISSTHLVKGLDRKLLERVRRGEDVLATGKGDISGDAPQDVDEELDKLEGKEVAAVEREKVVKKGSMATPLQLAGAKRSRDEIMAELKAQRKATVQAKSAPLLDNRWRKVGEKEKSRVKLDHKGREVLITVDEDGVVKKKVRKVAPRQEDEEPAALEMPNANKPVLGSDTMIPSVRKDEEVVDDDDDGDDNIFEGVGVNYDPLGNDDGEGSSDEEDETPDGESTERKASPGTTPEEDDRRVRDDQSPGTEVPTPRPRNYFNEAPPVEQSLDRNRFGGVEQFLKKAAKMDAGAAEDEDGEASNEGRENRQARLQKRAQMLASQDRDFDDMDMGFGDSRNDDGEDEGDAKVKLSEWKGGAADDDEDEKGGNSKKKRKPKKRKGDANNMADIMRVIDGRKAGGK